MPIRKCEEGGRPGWKCGNQGKCYTYESCDNVGGKEAKKKAIKQCLAEGEPISAELIRIHIAEDCEDCS